MSPARLPQVDSVLRQPMLLDLQKQIRRDLLAQLVRQELAARRAEAEPASASATPTAHNILEASDIALAVARRAAMLLQPQLRKVINGTGVILNTNLGRAPVSTAALNDLSELAGGYCNLELDLNNGKRGKRVQAINELLQLLTGAQASLVVNNTAAALLLIVNALARKKEVIVSRGELIEIGGSFRLPDVIESSGGTLKEVGTTNRTYIYDFEKAISDQTALLMRCHRSNFEITGFTEQVSLQQLVALANKYQIPLVEDLGSGALCDLTFTNNKDQPSASVSAAVESGCDLICFSGDKLLGGPQSGIIVGKKAWVDRLAHYPLYRALRLDKISLALLERSLISYLSPEPQSRIPVLAMLQQPVSDIRSRAERFARTANDAELKIKCQPIATESTIGGGSLPGQTLDSYGLALSLEGTTAHQLAGMLRTLQPPVIAIVQNDLLTVDFRTITEIDESYLDKALRSFGRK